ncbi:hypothetical protein DSC45_19455 [Streptomyces sp. YIM 130001]|uniref:hypothetical protein n=1 Tax=Streptomyces sp. YIM 130001 TaxID=2259644 RepID=UPI000E659540|nr:hypothetical protein [Streptomyces sp. YIM 130001]RII15074.1 hypothetical protein DSC45_19455 [Streptomyces sp. YIM 130001]
MSAMPLALLLTTAAATAVGAVALHSVRGLRKQITSLRGELSANCAELDQTARVPAARTAPEGSGSTDLATIRAAVAEALAEERERELAEARAFWAAQEARDMTDAPSLLGNLPPNLAEDLFLPRPADFAGLEPELDTVEPAEVEFADDSPELAAARRRHPSHPDFVPVQAVRDTVSDHESTVHRLEGLAQARTELSDVRPGPLGTLDVYVFSDGTTLCMTPGHRETAERLAEALRAGETPVLLGGSGISGAYTLTFECGGETVYILADRVIASA